MGIRQGFVYAAAVYTLCLVLATELFSVWNALRLETLIALWGGLAVLAALCVWFRGDREAIRGALGWAWARFRESPIALSAAGLILAVILLTAVVAPPNNWDSMAYHMARVAVWVQERSVAHYPTSFLPQLFHPPLAEWNILHFQILSGGDRFANAVQWFALVGCGIAASLIARELRQRFRVQVLAAVVAVTLPMGLLQGSSTQNDVVVSFWLLAFTLLAVQYLRAPAAVRLLFCGLSLGFALLSKGTAYAVAPPLAAVLFLYGIVQLQGKGYRPHIKLAGAAAAVLAVALLLNSGHYARNWELFGNPISAPGMIYRNDRVDLSVVWSNLVRNSVLHWGVPSHRINELILRAVRRVFGQVIDEIPGTTAGAPLFQGGIPFELHEDLTGNFLHYWVLAASLLGVLLFRKRFGFSALTVFLALAVVLGALSFCAILRWEPFASRRQTCLFMLGAPVVTVFAASLASALAASDWKTFGALARPALSFAGVHGVSIVTALFLAMSVPWVVFNETRPILPLGNRSVIFADRTEMYFSSHHRALFPAYVDAVDYLAAYNPKKVGLYMNGDDYNYPAWPLFKERQREMPRLEYVGVENVSGDLREGNYAPPFIFSRRGSFETIIEGASYRVVRILPGITVLAREDVVVEAPGKTVNDLMEEMIEGGDLALRSTFDVYVSEDILIYVKEPCGTEDVEATFFLHVDPADASDLPFHRQRHGFDSFAFRFNDHGVRSAERCVALRELPDYDFTGIRTGQYTDEGRVWEGEVRFDMEEMIEGGDLALRSTFDVHLSEDMLIYVKEPCGAEDVEATFFLHVDPADVSDLPTHHQRHGFDNLDFRFNDFGFRSAERCVAQHALPDYAITSIRTGQYTDEGRLWEGEVRFDE